MSHPRTPGTAATTRAAGTTGDGHGHGSGGHGRGHNGGGHDGDDGYGDHGDHGDHGDDDGGDYGSGPDTGFGGALGMNLPETLLGASFIVAGTGAGAYLLRRRENGIRG